MCDKILFPKEIIDNSQEANFSKHTITSKIIYTTIILFLIGVICLLPLIYVDVGVRSQGQIRPVTEVMQITSPVSGHIQTLNVYENSEVERGEILAVLEAPEVSEKLRFNETRQHQLSSFLTDLNILQQIDSLAPTTDIELNTAKYKQTWLEFKQQLISHQHEIEQLRRKLDRDQHLFKRDVISEAGFDETRFSWQSARNQYNQLIEQHQNQWKQEEIEIRDKLNQLQSEYTRLSQELKKHKIRSPINGTIQNADGISQNSYIYANQTLGTISPDTSLIAEVYVSPQDIGLLREGMEARFRIDAYDQNQWGTATGEIQDISADKILNEDQPVFRVRCSLDQTFLELQNGFRGHIKKGMTLQARFIVARRSIFQLLYDKVDDWLNPAWAENEFSPQTEV